MLTVSAQLIIAGQPLTPLRPGLAVALSMGRGFWTSV